MKRFIWLLILGAAAYGVWRYYPELEQAARTRTGADEVVEPSGGAGAIPDAPAAGGRAAMAPPAAAAVKRQEDDELAKRYPMPEFKPIEELVGQWKAIPPSAFPRQVTLKETAKLSLTRGTGTSKVEAGSKVYALAGTPEGALVIAPRIDAIMRGSVPMEATDFKDVLSSVYEDFKKRKRIEVEKLREAARREMRTTTPVVATDGSGASADVMATIGPRPSQSEDHLIPAVVESMEERRRTKKNAEPPEGATLGWGKVHFREVDNQPYWAVGVRYKARTIFGEFPTEALALMRHGKVIKWVYAGTGEPLP